MDLNGNVRWVVGASSGIGAAAARELTRRGAAVAVSARRREEFEEVGGEDKLAISADVTDVSSIAAASMRIRERLGRLM